jgi:hypothetical protein
LLLELLHHVHGGLSRLESRLRLKSSLSLESSGKSLLETEGLLRHHEVLGRTRAGGLPLGELLTEALEDLRNVGGILRLTDDVVHEGLEVGSASLLSRDRNRDATVIDDDAGTNRSGARTSRRLRPDRLGEAVGIEARHIQDARKVLAGLEAEGLLHELVEVLDETSPVCRRLLATSTADSSTATARDGGATSTGGSLLGGLDRLSNHDVLLNSVTRTASTGSSTTLTRLSAELLEASSMRGVERIDRVSEDLLLTQVGELRGTRCPEVLNDVLDSAGNAVLRPVDESLIALATSILAARAGNVGEGTGELELAARPGNLPVVVLTLTRGTLEVAANAVTRKLALLGLLRSSLNSNASHRGLLHWCLTNLHTGDARGDRREALESCHVTFSLGSEDLRNVFNYDPTSSLSLSSFFPIKTIFV